jgi:hypothetical protein
MVLHPGPLRGAQATLLANFGAPFMPAWWHAMQIPCAIASPLIGLAGVATSALSAGAGADSAAGGGAVPVSAAAAGAGTAGGTVSVAAAGAGSAGGVSVGAPTVGSPAADSAVTGASAGAALVGGAASSFFEQPARVSANDNAMSGRNG